MKPSAPTATERRPTPPAGFKKFTPRHAGGTGLCPACQGGHVNWNPVGRENFTDPAAEAVFRAALDADLPASTALHAPAPDGGPLITHWSRCGWGECQCGAVIFYDLGGNWEARREQGAIWRHYYSKAVSAPAPVVGAPAQGVLDFS